MLWKVFAVDTGKIVKAGFRSQDEAEEWLDLRSDHLNDDYEVEEMDSDEEDEWVDRLEENQDDQEADIEGEDSDIDYSSGYIGDDDDDSGDPDDLTIVMDEDLDL